VDLIYIGLGLVLMLLLVGAVIGCERLLQRGKSP